MTFQSSFGVSLEKIALLTTLNFGIQLLVDAASAGFVDRIGYRASIVIAHAMAAVGIAMMAVLPEIMPPFAGLLAASEIPLLGMIGCGLCGFSVGVLWPGSFSTAAKALPAGGTVMYAMLALAGDVGCGAGPTFVGTLAGVFGEDLRPAFICAVIFPILMLPALVLYKKSAVSK